jgi:hypothetical protein
MDLKQTIWIRLAAARLYLQRRPRSEYRCFQRPSQFSMFMFAEKIIAENTEVKYKQYLKTKRKARRKISEIPNKMKQKHEDISFEKAQYEKIKAN